MLTEQRCRPYRHRHSRGGGSRSRARLPAQPRSTPARAVRLHAFYSAFGRHGTARYALGAPGAAPHDIEVSAERAWSTARGRSSLRARTRDVRNALRIGDREWPIEVTLANRDMMSYRMLLGRRAISGDVLVDPSSSFLQPKLRYKVYER